MSQFFRLISVLDALNLISRIAPEMETEFVLLTEARGRVLSEDIQADINIPGFDRSVKDGYAVIAQDTNQATESAPVVLTSIQRVSMGQKGRGTIRRGECAYVPTGGMLPRGADAVVMGEYCQNLGDKILVTRPVAPGEDVLCQDEDFRKGEGVLTAGRLLKVQDIGMLAAVGALLVPVRLRPTIGIISTGIELVSPDRTPAFGEVRDVNTYLCGAFVEDRGGIPKYYGIVKDDPGELRAALEKAVAECDAVLVSGGSSKDDRDITAKVIAGLGEVFAHGIALAPGKPTIIGRIGKTPVIGVPGHPAATFVVLTLLGGHLMNALTRCLTSRESTRKVRLSRNIPSERGREEYVRVKILGKEAVPLFGKSGLLNTLVQSDGIVRIGPASEGLDTTDEVEVHLW
ncbi:molybdenum cofactor biosynthesis protein MoeA [Methanoculleus taiwanensis]|uniref:Molybdenum cofactor biosynthesis protein MoeA n=1 Tax=Methanoculleus taiwanensis TaxID=1550565 RepID=A0A498H4B4_9EURY|nr:gephyrin-like molybdotransferase Glp [Methanoculleus taiwanensis]RXE57025.1 molybdenum cofactor biosynthesis protein MoeA [Methanoculleus taiwanensis]